MRNGSRRRAPSIFSAASTTVSVSGRGSSTSGETISVRPQNSRRPAILDSGSPAARRAASSASRAAPRFPSGVSGAAISDAG